MDTLFRDLQTLLENHFSVLPIIFLTNKDLTLEDSTDEIYQQQNWPWILYDLESDLDQIVMIKHLVKYHDTLHVLDHTTKFNKYNRDIYLEAFKYNNQKIIQTYSTKFEHKPYDLSEAIYNAGEGGHGELILSLIPDVDDRHDMLRIVSGIYQLSDTQMINNIARNQNISLNYLDILQGLILSDKLHAMMDVINLMIGQNLQLPDLTASDFSHKTFDTIKYLLDNQLFRITQTNFIDLVIRVIGQGSLRLFELIISSSNRYWEDRPNYYYNIYNFCIDNNRWDIIEVLPNLLPLSNCNSRAGHRIILESKLILFSQQHLRSIGYRKTLDIIYKLITRIQ